MGRIGDGLQAFFQPLCMNLIHQQRQQNRNREAEQQAQKAQIQGVPNNVEGVIGGKEALEMLHAHPGAPPDAAPELEVLESDLHTRHGNILKDDIVDEGSIKSRLFHVLFLPADKKAKKYLKSLFSIIDENMTILSKYEKQLDFASLDEVCHPFSVIMASILSLYPYSLPDDSPKIRETLYNLGYSIGKWIYLMDALDDWKDDLDNDRFNPLNAIYNVNSIPFEDILNLVIEDIDFIIFSCLNNCSEYMKALPLKRHYTIIENVIDLGMPESYYSVIFKLKELLNLKETSVT